MRSRFDGAEDRWSVFRRATSVYELCNHIGFNRWVIAYLQPYVGAQGDWDNAWGLNPVILPGVAMVGVDERGTRTGTWTNTYASAAGVGYLPTDLTVDTTASNTTVTVTAGRDVTSADIGTRVTLVGAGSGGADRVTTITAVTDATHFVVDTAPSATLSGIVCHVHAQHSYSTTAGDTSVFAFPGEQTDLGIITMLFPNGGLAKVQLDNGAVASHLPTAQEVVDDGYFANTILVANGGTLAPTDRVVDCYASSNVWAHPLTLATDLPPGEYTATLTVTGYKRAAASAARVYLSGWAYGDGSRVDVTDPQNVICRPWLGSKTYNSAYEYAYQLAASGGAAGDGFSGCVHGNEDQKSIDITINGQPIGIAVGEWSDPGQVRVVKVADLYVAGTTDMAARITTEYIFARGMTIRHGDQWVDDITPAGPVYPVMIPAYDRVFNRAQFDVSDTAYTLDGDDDSQDRADAEAVVLWSSSDGWACKAELPSKKQTTNNRADAMWIQDRSGTVERPNKVYVERTATAIATGDRWYSEVRHDWSYFPGGASAMFPVTV